MAYEYLQKFLDCGLLNIAEDDEKFQHLGKTSLDIQKYLQKKKVDIIKYTLVALDSKTPPEDPVLDKVEKTLKKRWKTFRNKFPDTPRQMLRPIILQSLHTLGKKDPLVAAIIWLTGASCLPFFAIGREKDLLSDFLLEMGSIYQESSAKNWSSNLDIESFNIPSFKSDTNVTQKLKINEEELRELLAWASGPKDQKTGENFQEPNPHWPNAGPPWTQVFIPRAASGIAKVVNESYSGLLSTIIKQLNTNISTFDTVLKKIIDQISKSTIAGERRNLLLWWRESLYSFSQNDSYRSFEQPIVVLLMAYDLHAQVPGYCPQSVEFLLREAIREVLSTNNESISFNDFFNQLTSIRDTANLKALFSAGKQESGRIPILRFIENILNGERYSSKDMLLKTGIKGDSSIDFESLSVWIFRDLQARKIALLK